MTIDNLFDIQSEITRHIVAAVRSELTAVERNAIAGAPTKSLEAFEAYLHAKNILSSSGYNIEKYQEAEPYAELAVALDPGFAKAHLQLAEIHGYAYWMGYDTSAERQEAAARALDTAASLLDAGSPELLAARGEYLYRFKQDYPAAQDALLRAHVAMPGNAAILLGLGFAQRRLGLWEDALESFGRSSVLDPAAVDGPLTVASTLQMMREWSRLEASLQTSRERFSNDSALAAMAAMLPLWTRGDVATARGRLDKVRPNVGLDFVIATMELPWFERDFDGVKRVFEIPEVDEFSSLVGFAGYREMILAMAYQHSGEAERADQLLDAAIQQLAHIDRNAPNNAVAGEFSTLAMVLALKGEKDRAIAIAEEATQIHPLERDKAEGTYPLRTLCLVLALTGERERALVLLAELIDMPSGFVRWEMQLDPRWDFFRDDDRFNEIIRPHNLEYSFSE